MTFRICIFEPKYVVAVVMAELRILVRPYAGSQLDFYTAVKALHLAAQSIFVDVLPKGIIWWGRAVLGLFHCCIDFLLHILHDMHMQKLNPIEKTVSLCIDNLPAHAAVLKASTVMKRASCGHAQKPIWDRQHMSPEDPKAPMLAPGTHVSFSQPVDGWLRFGNNLHASRCLLSMQSQC